MKHLFLFALLAILTPGFAQAADTYKIDYEHSSVHFRVQHFGASWVWGRFNDVSGSFVLDEQKPQNSSVSITIKTASVDTNNAKRDKHLRSPDFFNAKTFPLITFRSTAITADGDNVKVTGDLSIHGKTQSVTIPLKHTGAAKDPWGNMRVGFEGELSVNRSDFGIVYMPGALSEEVKLFFGIEGIRQ